MMSEKKLGFGFMRLPLTDAENPKSVNLDQVCQMVDCFLERGFTYFDTAYMYHLYQSEIVLRETLVKRHSRESFTVATKLPVSMVKVEEDMDRIFTEQMEKCGVDYFDYYLLHNLNRGNYEHTKQLGCFAFVEDKKKAGIVKQVGFSFHDSAELLEEILKDHPEVDFVQLQINYIDWEDDGIQSRKCYEVAVRHGKKVIVMEPVKGGNLANVPKGVADLFKTMHPMASPASWAIRFAASLEHVFMVLSGMSDLNQLQDNMGYMEMFEPLSNEEHRIINKAVELIHAATPIACTACRYCVEGCPKHIAIPEYLALYNAENVEFNRGSNTQKIYYNHYTLKYGKASDCIRCGKCEKSCPQHLTVMEYLKKVADTFETGA